MNTRVLRLGRIFVPSVAVLTALSCKSTTEPDDTNGIPLPTVLQEELAPGRLYTLAIPATYTGDTPVPLILALHYGGHGAAYFGFGVLADLVEPALRELEAIILSMIPGRSHNF